MKTSKTISEKYVVAGLLLLLLIVFVVVIFSTENSYGGGDHYTHFKLAYWGWKYPELLFSHWGKPVFTLLISPFAQLGMNFARLFNVITGLTAAFLSWKLARKLKLRNSWLAVILVAFVPVYFSLMFAVMTEVLHGMFLVLAIWLFFKKEYRWSMITISFLPIIRTESIVLLPLFILAFGLKKQFKVLPYLATGFVIISLAGWHFYNGFWWLITEMPYKGSAAGIYGHGTLFHFINHTKGILGFPIAGLFLIGLFASIWLWYKKDHFHLTNRFYFLLLVPGVYLTFLAAHSFVWWKGLGNSLGLIRVMGSVAPLAGITALVGFDFIEDLFSKYKTLFLAFAILLFSWILVSTISISKFGFKKSRPQKVLTVATDFIKENNLDQYKIYYFNNYVPYRLAIDPYDSDKSSWGIPGSAKISLSIPDSSLIVWDAHFGPNEGHTPLQKLLDDDGLKVIKVFKPKTPFTVLGGYNYEVYIFQKAGSVTNGVNMKLDFEGDNPEFSSERAFSGGKSCHITAGKVFFNLINNRASDLFNDSCRLSVSGEIYFQDSISTNGVSFVVSREGDSSAYFYRAFNFVEIAKPNQWSHFDFSINLSSPADDSETIKVYFWNKKRDSFWIDDIDIKISPGSLRDKLTFNK